MLIKLHSPTYPTTTSTIAISVLCIRSVHLVQIIYCEMAWHEGLPPAILSHKRDKTAWRPIKPKNTNIWSPLDTGNPQNQNTYKHGDKTENTEIQKIIKIHRVIKVDHWFSLRVIQQSPSPPSLSLLLLKKQKKHGKEVTIWACHEHMSTQIHSLPFRYLTSRCTALCLSQWR